LFRNRKNAKTFFYQANDAISADSLKKVFDRLKEFDNVKN